MTETKTNEEQVQNVYEEGTPDQDIIDVATEIQAVLEKNEMAISPFIRFSQSGIVPDARIVRLNDVKNDTGETVEAEEEGGSEEAGESQDTEG